MDLPPPVPPKDPPYLRRMAINDPPSRPPTSGSKRKRGHEDYMTSGSYESHAFSSSPTHHQSSKRNRSSAAPSDVDTSDETTPAVARSLKRKKKVNNLSNLNLRHAAQQHKKQKEQVHLKAHGSKFLEGSLTDKPSHIPPSAFTRVPRSDNLDLDNVDTLMSDYHAGLETPSGTDRVTIKQEETPFSIHSIETSQSSGNPEESSGFFHFGRTFRPLALWNKLWDKSKEELTRQNEEEGARKAKQKAEAEAKYAEMKRSGMFGLQPPPLTMSSEDEEPPRDSAVILDSGRESLEEDLYVASGLLSVSQGAMAPPSAEQPADSTLKPGRGFRSRLHLKRPSLADLKNAFLPSRAVAHEDDNSTRDPSSSLSPSKGNPDAPASTVRRSASKYDMKKQQKLSKRVSDLETKLQQARRELDDALTDASPMPRLNNRYERFTPNSTFNKSTFRRTKLPRLDSERILLADLLGKSDQYESNSASRLTAGDENAEMSEGEDVPTVRQRNFQSRPITKRTSSQGQVTSENPTSGPDSLERPADRVGSMPQVLNSSSQEGSQPSADGVHKAPEHADPTVNLGQYDRAKVALPTKVTNPIETPTYANLDAKLKALSDQQRALARSKKSKRKSRATEEDKAFRPDADDDDAAEWEEAKRPKRKRKSGESINSSSPQVKDMSVSVVKVASADALPKHDEVLSQVVDVVEAEVERMTSSAKRISVDSQILEPLYEVEEETSVTISNGDPVKRGDGLPKPNSMNELVMRAALTAQQHRTPDAVRRVHKDESKQWEWPDDVF